MKRLDPRRWLAMGRDRRAGRDLADLPRSSEDAAKHDVATTRLRSAGAGDIDAMVDLIASVQKFHSENEPSIFIRSFNRDAARKYFEDIMTVSSLKVLIAERGRCPAAYLLYKIERSSSDLFRHGGKRLYVAHIAVRGEMRRLGIGSLLLQAVEAEAKAKGVAEVALDTWSFNEGAQRFFRAAGYEPQRIVMRKRVP